MRHIEYDYVVQTVRFHLWPPLSHFGKFLYCSYLSRKLCPSIPTNQIPRHMMSDLPRFWHKISQREIIDYIFNLFDPILYAVATTS